MNPNNPARGDDRHMFGFMASTGFLNCICGWTKAARNRTEALDMWREHVASLSSPVAVPPAEPECCCEYADNGVGRQKVYDFEDCARCHPLPVASRWPVWTVLRCVDRTILQQVAPGRWQIIGADGWLDDNAVSKIVDAVELVPSSHTDADDIEQYRSYKAPGVDCPECFVDTGDSEHVVGCSIGAALGCATRPPMRDGILLRCHCGSELMVSGKAHGSALLHHADESHTVMGPLALGPILGGLND